MKMKIRIKAARCLVLTLLLIAGLNIKIYGANFSPGVNTDTNGASTSIPEENTEHADAESIMNQSPEEDSINFLPVVDPEHAAAPEGSAPEYEQTSYTEDIFFPQKTLKGIYSSVDLYFYVQDYWDTKYVYAQIQYDVSELIEGTSSSVTFAVNNTPLQSYKLEYNNGSSQIFYVKIPMSEVRTGYNSFTMSAYARLYNEEGCVDDYSDANWLRIDETSYIRCGYESKYPEHKISQFPYPFMSTYYPTGKGLTIAVSDKATTGEITAAMNLMADLSTVTKDKNEIQVCLLSDLEQTDPTRTILISGYDNLPEEYKSLVLKAPDSNQNATVSDTEDSHGNPLLIITSSEDSSLVEAAYMLMDESRCQQENEAVASVEKGSSQIAVNAAAQNAMIAGNYTLNDIMGRGLSFVGPFHQEKYIYLPVSKDFVLSESGKIALKFRYSENLDFTRSLVTVYWGDVPVASKRLKKENASGDELNFEMPADMIGTAATSLKLSFDLEIADMICTPRQSDMPWAYVSKESTIFLPPSSGITLSFDIKASPFRKNGIFNDVMLVITDVPTTHELNLLGQIVAMYGNEAKPYGGLTVKRVSEFRKDDADYNIITTGTFEKNPLISQINDKLDFKYTSDGNGFESNEQLIMSKEYAGKIAAMQLIKSPFSFNRGLLAVTGSNDPSLLYVQECLRDKKIRDRLTKDCVILNPDTGLTAFQFIQKKVDQGGPTLAEKLVQNKKSLMFTVIATSAMFLMLLAMIIILLRIRTHRKKMDE